MIYPNYLKKDDAIGISALSAGVGDDIEEYEKSLSFLSRQNKIIETASVRNNALVANTPIIRAKELNSLVSNKDIKAIICAAGGDGQLETLPYIDYENIKNNPKWYLGASDPTNLLFVVTTMLDIATLYSCNAKSFVGNKDDLITYEYLYGKLSKQESYETYQPFIDYINDNDNYLPVRYESEKNFKTKGRIIGGCLDCLAKIIGTPYDHVNKFIEKYKDDGIIWYFDIFSMSAFDVYLTLLQFKLAGYFKYTKAILFGRVAFESIAYNQYITSYKQAYSKVLENIPFISEMDIGHTHPHFTIINGAIVEVEYNNHKGSISYLI